MVLGQITLGNTQPRAFSRLIERHRGLEVVHSNMVTPDKRSDDEVARLGRERLPLLRNCTRSWSAVQPGLHNAPVRPQAGLAGLAQRDADANAPAQVSCTCCVPSFAPMYVC
jgi:hypothetical protein